LVIERIAGKDYTTLGAIHRMRELCCVDQSRHASISALQEQASAIAPGSSSIAGGKLALARVLKTSTELKQLSRRTSARNTSAIERLSEFFGIRPASTVNADLCAQYTQWRINRQDLRTGGEAVKTVSFASARREQSVLGAALTWAWRNGRIDPLMPISLRPPRRQGNGI
jgi:hypothetical protein